MYAKSLQSYLTLCNPMDCSPSGSSVHGIFQARTLEQVAIPSSRGSSQPRNQTYVLHLLHWQPGSLPLVPPEICLYICPATKWRREWQPTPVLLPGKSLGWRNLVGYSPWGREESDMTERLQFHFSLSCIGEGNGNILQCSCLENPGDGGAWQVAIYGVIQSWTRLKQLSSSSSSLPPRHIQT